MADKDIDSKVLSVKEAGSILGDAFQGFQNKTDAREEAYSRLSEFLFDDDKLLWVSRLTDENSDVVLKNKIVVRFFQEYYNNIRVKISFIKQPNKREETCLKCNGEDTKCDFCNGKGIVVLYDNPIRKPECNVNNEEMHKLMKDGYNDFINDMLKTTISYNGLSRKEIIQVLNSANESMSFKDRLSGWMNKPF